ncbi:MAG: YkoF family thiamine/hydroxymethylpyrimidine-binding protein [Kiritimatiellia bacterium]|nr:thiamine-binding protein [Lentisphaerota bacterium]
MKIQAELSLYPLRTQHLSGNIANFTETLQGAGLHPKTGAMSTSLSGEVGQVFAAVARAFERCAASSDIVLVLKAGNACPVCPTQERVTPCKI